MMFFVFIVCPSLTQINSTLSSLLENSLGHLARVGWCLVCLLLDDVGFLPERTRRSFAETGRFFCGVGDEDGVDESCRVACFFTNSVAGLLFI